MRTPQRAGPGASQRWQRALERCPCFPRAGGYWQWRGAAAVTPHGSVLASGFGVGDGCCFCPEVPWARHEAFPLLGRVKGSGWCPFASSLWDLLWWSWSCGTPGNPSRGIGLLKKIEERPASLYRWCWRLVKEKSYLPLFTSPSSVFNAAFSTVYHLVLHALYLKYPTAAFTSYVLSRRDV